MESSPESRKAAVPQENDSLMKREHNHLVVNLVGLIDSLLPTEDTPEAERKRQVGRNVKDAMIEKILV